MATPPFNFDTANPADNAAETNFPANERAFRDNVASYMNFEHDINSGHHQFPRLTTAGRDGIVDWPGGSVVYNTDLGVLQFFNDASQWINIGPVLTINPSFQLITTTTAFGIPSASLALYMVGGGGGGAGGTTDPTTPGGGSGGGAGAYVVYYLDNLTVGLTLTVTIGAAGVGGAAGSPGTAGGNTILTSGTQSITTATAGGGGAGATTNGDSNGGAAGTPSGGIVGQTLLLTGSAGQNGWTVAALFGMPGYGGTIASSLGGFGFGGRGGKADTSTGEAAADGVQGAVLVTWFT